MRKTKIKDITIEHVISGISKGLTLETACLYAGITKQSYYNYKKKQEQKENKLFFEKLEKAEIDFELAHLKVIQEAGAVRTLTETKTTILPDGTTKKEVIHKEVLPQWQSSAWILERRFNEKYSRYKNLQEQEEHKVLAWNDNSDIPDPPDPLASS